MWKTLLAGTTALVIASGTLAFAQQPAQQPAQPTAQSTNQTSNPALDARLARVKARLGLTSEQEANWPAVDAAIRDIVKERMTRISQRRAARETVGAARPDVIARMRLRADAMTTRAADLKKLADASEPLYKSLTDNQKRRLAGMMRNASAFAQQDERRFGEGRRGDRGPRYSHHNDRGRYGDRDRYVR